jgi:hypothetical protein
MIDAENDEPEARGKPKRKEYEQELARLHVEIVKLQHLQARCTSAASLGQYTPEMEAIPVSVGTPPHRRELRDD